MDTVSLRPTEYPALQMPDKAGIRIHAIVCHETNGPPLIRLAGICQCTQQESLNLPKTILHGVTVVLVYGQDHLPVSFQAIGDAIVFDDDIIRIGDLLRGYFEIDLFKQSGSRPLAGTYFVSAASGPHLSNVVKIEI